MRKGEKVRRWTEQDERELVFLAGRKPVRWIAKRFGRSTHAVEHKLSRLGISGSRLLTLRTVAKILRVSHSTVAAYRDRLNQRWRQKSSTIGWDGATEDQVEEMARALLKGLGNAPHTLTTSAHLRQVANGDWTIP